MSWISHEICINGIGTSGDVLRNKERQRTQNQNAKHWNPDIFKCQQVEHVEANNEQDHSDTGDDQVASGIAFTGEICRFTVTNQGGHLVLSEILLSPA